MLTTRGDEPIKAIIFDVDGTIMPQGGPASQKIIKAFSEEIQNKMIAGPSTGKGADYMRGVAAGIGLRPWQFIGAENGGLLMHRTSIEPVTYESHNAAPDLQDLSDFIKYIQLDQFRRKFKLINEWVHYRPELKETILTLFPAGRNIEETKAWEVYFNQIIADRKWELNSIRNPDGCIDIVPKGVSKSNTVYKIMDLFQIKADQIIVAAYGKNDTGLFVPGVKSIIVGNTHKVIKSLGEEHRGYMARGKDGEGFLEGLKHYDVL